MSAFVNPFVSGRHERLIGYVLWLAIALALIAGAIWFSRVELHNSLRREAKAELAHFDKLNANVAFAFDELQRTATAPACTSAFMQQLRRVAFLPDGLNEFIYAPLGMVTCSTSISPKQQPLSLGPPDFHAQPEGGFAVWANRRLDKVGLPDVFGTVVLQGAFAVVVPPHNPSPDHSSWAKKEIVLAGPDGRFWHVAGESGLYKAATDSLRHGATAPSLHEVICGDQHSYCVAMKADLAQITSKWRAELILAVCLIAFYAIWPASVLHRRLNSFWSMESRFRRNLNADSVICAYQPILDLRTGEIAGCEVLARWRDVDGSVVAPDKFIDLVETGGKTLAFTKMVANRAFAELSQNLPSQEPRLQVNFNIFPRDLDSEKLGEAFRAFDGEQDRFPIALEIVESDSLGIDTAEREIEALARRGIRTYVDDFGNGYSSIHRVASLAIHGVKLDRSFAMAPSESLMARMLGHAVDMMASSGREIVVEGVETRERLDFLIESGRVAYAQGYLISRPLSIEGLAQFLAKHDPAAILAQEARAAA